MTSESSPQSRPQLRKTRFVCISDTHNQTPKLPPGDVLIHAGDLTNQGSITELRKTVAWLEKADFEAKIVIAGNHDITLDKAFYHEHGDSWRFPQPQDPDECLRLLTESPSITYLQHQAALISLQSPTGPHTHFKVWGSPYSPVKWQWAFQYEEKDATNQWDEIPLDTDIVLTHTPPRNHCDANGKGHSRGCEALRKALWHVRPRLAICGHIHGGRGVERVKWKLDEPFSEEGTEVWTDPGAGSKKQSLVDLTIKGRNPLDNGNSTTGHDIARRDITPLGFPMTQQSMCGGQPDGIEFMLSEGNRSSHSGLADSGEEGLRGGPNMPKAGLLGARSDRRETCMINAAVKAAGWEEGPKRFNKPIVVDIDLPVWTDGRIGTFAQ